MKFIAICGYATFFRSRSKGELTTVVAEAGWSKTAEATFKLLEAAKRAYPSETWRIGLVNNDGRIIYGIKS